MELKQQQNEKKIKVGLLVTATVHSNFIIFRRKLHESIEKCLLYSAMKKSAQTNVRCTQSKNKVKKTFF
jgi:hypothetical protein